MGSTFSQQILEAKERDGLDLVIESIHIKSKELPSLTKKLLTELPIVNTVELRACKIKKLPSNINLIYNLSTLIVCDNKLTSLPSEMAGLVNLKELDLSGNSISRLPMELSSLPLHTINLSRNQLSTLPNFQVNEFSTLTNLNLEKNEFSSFPASIAMLTNIKILNMNFNKISSLSFEDFSRLKDLSELYFRGNQISTISKHLKFVQDIIHLDLSENQIKEIPSEINLLTQLQTLELQHNQITVIPEELLTIESLSCLKLSDNSITILPESIGNLINLTELYLRENRIRELPSSIGRLPNLRKLYFEYNELQAIPIEIADLKKLVVLILHHNNISTLPDELCTMGSLLRLSLDDNPLDEKLLQIIKDEGALSLIQRVEEEGVEGGRKSYRASTLKRRSFRNKNDQSTPNLSRSVSIKSISELTATKTTSLGVASKNTHSISKKNSTDPSVPSYSKFKSAFDSLLEEQDFSQKKREVLKKLPEGEKWNLLSQYKGSTLNLIKNSNNSSSSSVGKGRLLSKSNSAQQKAPRDYIPLLKENRANKNTMERIKANLKQSDWLSKFVDASGIQAVVSFLRSLLLKKPQSSRDLTFMLDCYEILKIFLGISLKSLLTTSGAVEAITMGLYSNFLEVKQNAVDVLDSICQDESVGALLTLEALSSLSLEFEEEFRFMPLIQFLEAEDTPEMSLLTCLSLVNFIVDSVEDLQERFQIRMEFMTMGFKELLANLPQNLLFDLQKSNFEEQTANDYEDMICRKQAATNAQNPSEGKLSISLITEKVHTTLEIQISDNLFVHELIEQIVQKYKIDLSVDYGLFDIHSASPNQPLDDDLTIKDCNLSGNQLEFKMKDWDLTIFLSPNNQVISIPMNPQYTTEHVIRELVNLELIPEGNYCLKVNLSPVLLRLDDAKPLLAIEMLRDKMNWKSLLLDENPIQLKVFLAEDTWQIMEFNLHIKISEIFSTIVTQAGIAINRNDYSLVLEDKTSDSSSLLDFDKTLSYYEISDPDNCRLKFVLKSVDSQQSKGDDEEDEIVECNIWDESPDSPQNITFEQGKEKAIQNIETATLNKLVERVTSADEYDVDFVNVFVLMFHGFTTEEQLWNKLLERFEVPDSIDDQTKMKIRTRVCIFIKNWVEKDLLGSHVRGLIQQFVTTRMTDQQYSLMAKVILDRLNNPKGNEEMQISVKPPCPLLPRNVFAKLTIFDIEDLEIARQMTIYLFNIYKKIRPRELFRSAWNKEKLKHLSPNVLSMIDYYNRISNCIATAIVMEPKVRNRARLLEKVISIAEKLRELNNFHLLSAFISAINNSAILRLKFTKARLPKKHKQTLATLEETMSMDSSFSHYRNALAAAKPPCIPFMGVYLTDLTFIADGNPDRIENRINFVKQKFVYSVIAIIKAYQTTPYNLDEVDSIQQFIHNLPTLADKEIYSLSLQIEPRNAERGDIQ